jgi:hypothetical protein
MVGMIVGCRDILDLGPRPGASASGNFLVTGVLSGEEIP